MQISVTFDPAKDLAAAVHAAVDAAYGSPKPHASAPITAQPTDVGSASPHSQASSPVTTAPTAQDTPNSATSASPAGVVLDKDGVPWDERIHSGGTDESGQHKKTAKGVWAKRKGVSDLDYSTITRELQSLMAQAPVTQLPAGGVLGNPVNVPHQVAVEVPGQPGTYVVAQATAPQAQVTSAPVATAPVGVSAPQMGVAPVAMQAAPVLPNGVAPMPVLAPMPTPTPIAPHDYVTLAQWVAPQMESAGGKLKPEHVEHFCRQCGIVDTNGVGQFALVVNRPDAVSWLYEAFQAQIAAVQ